MTTTTMTRTYDKLHDSMGELLYAVAAQSFDTSAADRLASKVLDAGKASPARTVKEKKLVTVEPTAALSSDDKVARPNGELYYTRQWGEHKDVAVLRTGREHSMYALIYGEPGCGKTALIEAAFATEDGGLHTILGSGDTEVADLVGGFVQTPGGNYVWEDGPLVKAAEAGEVLLVDEIGLIDTKVLAVMYGLMDGRREYNVTANPDRGVVKAKDGFYVVAATNPNAPGVRLSEALISRFSLQAEMTTDWGLARKLGVSTQMVTVAQNLAKKRATNEVSWGPQMRELLAFRDLERVFGTKFAVSNLLAAAPEMDRPIVADVLARVIGETCLPAKI
jgi:hypothetical protein